MKNTLITIVVMACIGLVASCGEEPKKAPKLVRGVNPLASKFGAGKAAPVAEEGGAAATGPSTAASSELVPVPNERWDRIKPFFVKFAGASTLDKADPFRDNLVQYVELPELPAVVEEEVPDGGTTAVNRTPLQRYPLEEFSLLMIMSGTSQPKAVILDPMGIPWIVRKDTPLGDKGGLVQNITQYSIVVAEPGADSPSVVNIRPVILDAAAELAGALRGGLAEPLTTAPLP